MITLLAKVFALQDQGMTREKAINSIVNVWVDKRDREAATLYLLKQIKRG